MRPFELASQIVAINQTAIVTTGFKLQNIIINTHGAPGALRIGGFNVGATYKEDLGAFAFLKPFNVGTIWLVSCDAARDTSGQSFCQTLANVAGTQVIASDAGNVVTVWQGVKLFLAYRWNIDDFEGTVYSFAPGAVMAKGIDPEKDIWTVWD